MATTTSARVVTAESGKAVQRRERAEHRLEGRDCRGVHAPGKG